MHWDVVAALSQLAGAIAVVATLYYLARQVRESSKEARRNRWCELHNEISRVADSWAENDRLSDVVYRGFIDYGSLTPQERFRFYSSLFRLLRSFEALFQYSREGGVYGWGAEGFRKTMADILGFPGTKTYWDHRRHWYSREFQAEVDLLIGGARAVAREAYESDAAAQ
jgi:hypothetical protein